MSAFAIDEGSFGEGAGSYEAGLLTLSDGRTRGVEDISRVTSRDSTRPAAQAIPGFLGGLRSALPALGGLSLPTRLAVSTVRAGLGVIEDGLAPREEASLPVEFVFSDGAACVARISPRLLAMIRRDRDVVLGALDRAARPRGIPAEATPDGASAEALTSIFRYEKRNGRLRRIADPEPPKG